uniref:Neuronal acetylcholine receptor subunit alpha-2-like n=1 Tax=Saccoglossus kowalevskii TaxID=10224 RepID=A0ABM0MSW2_SACKO|nr:PREDICTED: neuronal acetylcholine receptor subunit alpha-2-like [Saccoglossus kowalevskii]
MADEETGLLEDLLSSYNMLTRPVENKSDIADVFIDLVVVKIPDITWIDYRLSWNASNYSDIQWLLVPSEKVWFPELYLENTFIEGELPSKPTYVRIESNGTVLSHNHAVLESHCYLDMTYFPFDSQKCSLRFLSRIYYNTELRIHVKENVSLDDFVLFPNYEWTVLEVFTRVNAAKTSVFSPDEQSIAVFEIHLERVFLYYTVNIIVPTFLLSALSLCVFWLPPDCGERISLSVSLLVTMSVFELLIADIIPTNINKIPLISQVILFDMAVIGTTIIISTIVINMQRKSTSGRPVGKVSRRLCLGRRCCSGTRGRSDSTDNHHEHVVLANIGNHEIVVENDNDALRGQIEEYNIERNQDVSGKNRIKDEITQDKYKCHQTQMEVTKSEWEALIRNVDCTFFYIYLFIFIAVSIEVERMWHLKTMIVSAVDGAPGLVNKNTLKHVDTISGNPSLQEIQKIVLNSTAHLLVKALSIQTCLRVVGNDLNNILACSPDSDVDVSTMSSAYNRLDIGWLVSSGMSIEFLSSSVDMSLIKILKNVGINGQPCFTSFSISKVGGNLPSSLT